MNSINTLIKWPGGKAREIKYIKEIIPRFDRYVEPFFGGGAMFFYLQPKRAIINDISADLTEFYKLAKEQNKSFHRYLCAYDTLLTSLLNACDSGYSDIYSIYDRLKSGNGTKRTAGQELKAPVKEILGALAADSVEALILDKAGLEKQVLENASDKMLRTVKNEAKSPYSDEDLKENLITGFTSGLYMYFRDVYNDILLKRGETPGIEYDIANFYFIREYCYGSMFRYNRNGEFNIPYGGMSYNRKSFKSKIDAIFSKNTEAVFEGTEIYCKDFEDFFSTVKLDENDFMFLDPPYDSDFSDYEGKSFTRADQKRLSDSLKKTRAKFVLLIKNTDYIHSLYRDDFTILSFEKTYTYNVRSRNDRSVEHLIITNIPGINKFSPL